MKILVCNKNREEREDLVKILRDHWTERHESVTFVEYESSREAIAALEDQRPHLVVLQVTEPSDIRRSLMVQIRKLQLETLVLYSSPCSDEIAELTGEPYFLLEPVDRNKWRATLNRYHAEQNVRENSIQTHYQNSISNTPYESILFIEVLDKLCYIHTLVATIKTYSALDALQARIGDRRFLRCHRSFIVNMQKVQTLESGNFVLHTGHRVPVSRGKKKWVTGMYAQYIGLTKK